MPTDHSRNVPPLSPALETFCTRFAAGAGPAYQWELYGTSQQIRTQLGTHVACPVSAESTFEFGHLLWSGDVTYVLSVLALLTRLECDALLCAADGIELDNPLIQALRIRLLRICGLREEA